MDENNKIDYRDLTVADLLTKKHDRITYEYDYGDRWEHDIFLEDITTVNPQIKYPVCIEGKMSCPPEDCGGINGYHDILFILKILNTNIMKIIKIGLMRDSIRSISI